MSGRLDVEILADSVSRLIIGRGYRFDHDSQVSDAAMTHELCAPDKLLPVLVRMADLMWRRQTGMDCFRLDLVPATTALVGHALTRVEGASLALIIACVDEILRLAVEDDVITIAVLEKLAGHLASSPHPQRAEPD
ncbi:hypothetical protein [Acetobacter vaccinii]|uniref:Uncharacterized protein n=1 Tax=Acetobacter vaccinii TaxID=2592655 RepID=A0A5C1YTD5_9PROT|nr:hypothetical protein [Acetobacter vaccinii]QEO18975.1 hypothetical protein FLP30_14035 [Acetobacter vaccinii]